jgi:hypothetical protein
MNEDAYEARAAAMTIAQEIETLGRLYGASGIVVDLPSGDRVRFTPNGTWVIFADDRPAYALAWHRVDRAEREAAR